MAASPTLPLIITTLCVCLFLASSTALAALAEDNDLSYFNRSSFPPGFIFGAATSAYQFEGAAAEDGKGPSIWDYYTHKYPDKILDGTNGDVANDMYHRYKEDVKLLKSLGMDALRLSISWPRILPRGKLSGGVNQAGIDFYNNFFDELKANGITPLVTLFHWDTPQALEEEYQGFLSPRIVDDFRDFTNLCFEKFGDRVKNWMTFNEPFSFASTGYDGGFVGSFAPGRCTNCTPGGNSATEPYIVAHNLLLAHAEAVKLYRQKYQPKQKGKIGIVLVTHWFLPYNASNLHDVIAAKRTLDFLYGWFLEPITYGRYPKSMVEIVGNRLPKFTPEQSAKLKGSIDYLGLNYYTGNYAAHISSHVNGIVSSTNDKRVNLTTSINGVNIGKPTGVSVFFVYPDGLRELLIYTKKNYKNPTIIITETGIGDVAGTSVEQSTNDPQRIDYYNGHLKAVRQAIFDGKVDVKGFFAWSYMDCFEWGSGFTMRFGLIYIDYKNNLKRIPKRSALWVRKCLTGK